jgi:SAM-dependent methyltransferase
VNDTSRVGIMPVDRERWKRELHLSNFVNAYYQLRDLESLAGCRRVLMVGPGQGLGVAVLKWRGFDVTTLDVDDTFEPDVLGSVHEMDMFRTGQFDAVVVSHVLEHLPVTLLEGALSEMARVARSAIVYVPKHGVHVQARFATNYGDRTISLAVNLFNYFARTAGLTADYMGGQHYWEMGLRGFRATDLRRRFATHFRIIREYRNPDWPVSYNFVLESLT